jgi:hypothetical protein
MNSLLLRLTRKLVRFLRAVTDRLETSLQPEHSASEPRPMDGLRSAAAYEVAKQIGADWTGSPYGAKDSRARRLALFDQATERQRERERRWKRRRPGTDRGWRREDLYGRGRTR